MNQEYLRQCFDYCQSTGMLTWRERPESHFRTRRGSIIFNAQMPGNSAGCHSSCGRGLAYLKVRLDKRLHHCHRIVWQMLVGEIPDGMSIDHINGDGLDNRIENLRLVTHSQNMKNVRLRAGSKSGHHGIYWSDRLGGWIAQAWSDGKHLGSRTFAEKEEAIAWRLNIQMRHGFHENHGRPAG